jgi:hypothetical protein
MGKRELRGVASAEDSGRYTGGRKYPRGVESAVPGGLLGDS